MNPDVLVLLLAALLILLLAFVLFVRKRRAPAASTLTLADAPYPKERPDEPRYTSAAALRQAFYAMYDVSDPAWWDAHVGVRIDPSYPGAAGSSNDIVTMNPAFAVPQVLAHECCHSLYSKLTPAQQARFQALLPGVVAASPLIGIAIRDYGPAPRWQDVAAWEAHAQVYRYFGRRMPPVLNEFYPHLV